ncbi:MAG: hypothetical protein ACPG4X_15775 [Pikeienuella sp.]
MIRLALAAIFAIAPMSAFANDQKCAPNAEMIIHLKEKFGEMPMVSGFDGKGQVVIWWGNLETGTWTATVPKGGQTCMVASGGQFKRVVLAPNV